MAERSFIFESTQMGLETVPGTAVAASKKLLATSFEVGANPDISIYRANGYKFSSIASLNKEYVTGKIKGQMSFNDLAYLFASLVNNDAPAVVGTTGHQFDFSSVSTGPDTPATFTIEQGSSVHAHRFAGAMVTGLTLSFSDKGCDIDGSIMGRALEDGVTLTATPTEIALAPVMRPQVTLKLADTSAGLPGATALTRGFSVDWALTNRYAPVFALNGLTDWDAYTESEPKAEVSLLMEADAVGMALLTNMRAGSTKFARIQALGPQIGAGPAVYSLIIDTALKITDVDSFSDHDGIVAVKWTASMVHDTTFAKAFVVNLITSLVAL